MIEVVAFAGALADAGKHRIAAMRLGDVVDQFHDQHGLADAGAAEQADLAALGIGREQIDDLDAGDEDLRFGRLIGEGRRLLVDRRACSSPLTGPASSTGSPMTLMMRPSVPRRPAREIGAPVSVTSWPRTRPSVVSMATVRTVDFAEMLRDFEHQAIAVILGLERVEDRRQVAVELHVDDGADDLGDASDLLSHCCPLRNALQRQRLYQSASAPEMISISSLVIIA